jgi:branched-chain amino acid transport system substrate-binding protein
MSVVPADPSKPRTLCQTLMETNMTKLNEPGYSPTRRTILKNTLVSGGTLAATTALPLLSRSAFAQAPSSDVVHIGASLPLTGSYEKVARICKDAYDFWTKTYNGKMVVGGKERQIRWTFYDDENNSSRVAQLTEKLLTSDKVDILVGSYGTDTILSQGAIVKKHGKIFVQTGASSIRVDEELGGHTAFTANGRVGTYGVGAMNYLATKTPKPKRVGLVIMDDPVYVEIAEGVRQKCKEHGMEVVAEVVLPMNVQDLRPTALKLRTAGPLDVVYNTGWDVICVKLVEEMAAIGVNPKAFVGGHLTGSPVVKNTLGAKMQGIIGTAVWLPQFGYRDDKFASTQEFADKYRAQFGYTPTYQAAFSYIIPWIYQQVLRDANPADPFNTADLRRRLGALNVKDSIWGPISFDERGRIRRDAAPAIQWMGNPASEKIVSPTAMAESQGIYPKPAW